MALPTGSNPFRTISRKIIHTREHVRFVQVEVAVHGVEKDYSFIDVEDDVMVIAVNDQQEFALVGQWRFPVERYCWEAPAGFLEEGEMPLEGAKRELREEAGVVASEWTSLGEAHLETSSKRITHLFLAQGLSSTEQSFDDDEEIEVLWLSFDDLLGHIADGSVNEALTMLAIYKAKDALGL